MMSDSGTLIERQEELAFGADALDGPGVVITGTAGVGKTRLATALAGWTRQQGATTVRILCTTATADIPLGALAPLLPPTPTTGDELGSSQRLHLLSALRETVRGRANGTRPVVAVDDAHLLDEVGAAALLQLVVGGDITILATVRTGEPVPDPIRSLWRDAGCPRLELQNLSADGVHLLVEATVDGPVAPSTSTRLWELTQGNPLFAHEVMTAAIADGTLAESHGIWVWSGQVSANASLEEIVADRLGRLSDDDEDAVSLVAAGEPLALDLLVQAVGDDPVHRLERAGLVEVVRSDTGDLSAHLGHPLYGEVLRSRHAQTVAARRRLVALIGEEPDQAQCLQTAVWAMHSNAPLPPPVFLAACEQARVLGNDHLAVELAEAATAADGGEEASVALGRALADAQRPEAEEVLLPHLDAADQSVRAVAVTALADFYRYVQADPATALATFDRAGGFDEPWSSYVTASQATIMCYSGRMREAAELSVPLLDNPDPRVRIRAVVPAAMALSLDGRMQTALERVDALMDDAMGLGERLPPALSWWVGARLLALFTLGDHDGLTAMIDTVRHQSPDDGAAFFAHFALLEGRSLLVHGRPASAAEKLRDAVAHAQPGGEEEQRWAASLLAEAHAVLGQTDKAVAALAQADVDSATDAVFYPDMLRARSWVTAAQGSAIEAHEQVLHGVDAAATAGAASIEIAALHDAARLGADVAPIAERAAELATWMEGPMPAAMNTQIQAIAAGTSAALTSASLELEAAGMTICAAECAAAAGDMRRARALAARCEGAGTPALTRIPLNPLTRREREVATLAADGLTSRTIAERLFVSVRTVDNHLSRTYAKLDVSSRDELRGALDGV